MASIEENISILVNTARPFRAIIELAEQYEEVARYVSQTAELKAQIESCQTELEAKSLELLQTKDAISAAQAKAVEIVAKAEQDGRELMAKAKEDMQIFRSNSEADLKRIEDETKLALQTWKEKAERYQEKAEASRKEFAETENKLVALRDTMRKIMESAQ